MQRAIIVSLTLLVWAGLPLGSGTSEALGQSSAAVLPGDGRAVNFALPGDFAGAQRVAEQLNRCVLIKGVAGGMDQLGATECTKGHW